jgi:hypothetical protein
MTVLGELFVTALFVLVALLVILLLALAAAAWVGRP